ncbi:MAG TPA: hypothetical protein VGD72_07330 [Mycobacteriales bacterium]
MTVVAGSRARRVRPGLRRRRGRRLALRRADAAAGPLASAVDAGKAFDLRCEIREKLLGWLNEHHPHALPRARIVPDLDLREATSVFATTGSGARGTCR